jgi:hypothetical protein
MMQPSEHVVRRKPGSAYNSAGGPDYSNNTYSAGQSDSMGGQQHAPPQDSLVSAEPEFRYAGVLMLGLMPPFLIMLAFGGRPAILVVCFGTIVTYIFDLLGAMEATLVTILVSLLALWGSLLYAARYLLQRSFLYNIPLLITFAVVLVWIFIVLAGDFRSVRNEFDSSLLVAEAWLFTVMPMTCSALVTWCLCVELPSLEFPLCFSMVYCAYLAVMARPRKSCLGGTVANSDPRSSVWSYIIAERDLLALYVLPCVVSPLLYIIVHRNVIMNFGPRIQGLLLSIAVPSILVLTVAERQIDYWPADNQKSMSQFLEMWKLGMLFVGIFSIKDHHFFDDLKVFSASNLLPEAMLTPVLALTMLFTFIVVYQYQSVKKEGAARGEDYSVYGGGSDDKASSVLFNHPTLSVCVCASALGVGLITGVTLSVLPVFVMGVVALAEYYLATSRGLMRGREFLGLSLVATGAFPVAIVCQSFTDVTLRFLNFGFSGSLGITIDIQAFCTYCSLLTIAAVVLPTLLAGGGGGGPKMGSSSGSLGFVPGSSKESMTLFWSSAAGVVFSVGAVVFAAAAAFLELLVLEQDWSGVSPSVEFIYPTWLFISTAVLLVAASYHVYTIGVMDISAVMCVAVLQGCKLLHLADATSAEIFTAGALLLALLFPFFSKASQMAEGVSVDVGGMDTLADIVKLLLYSMVVFWPLMWARESIIETMLRHGLGHPPSAVQSWCACVAIFSGFATCGLLVFWKSASFIRRYRVVCLSFVVYECPT